MLNNFIRSYTKSDFDQIKFDWNGKYDEDLFDSNFEFRLEVCNYIVNENNFSIVCDDLLIDLYIEFSKYSRESWSVYENYNLFAEEIIKRNPTKNIIVYLTGATYCQDTAIASGQISISKTQRKEILAQINLLLSSETNEQIIKMLLFGKERFSFVH